MKQISLSSSELDELGVLECALKSPERIYLPNIRPTEKVDFMFIGTEPSLGKWASSPEVAAQKIKDGFRNFIFSLEDFIMLYAIENYLTKSYIITDISKFAVPVTEANRRFWIASIKTRN